MPDDSAAPADTTTLREVVRGLRDQHELQFGIGAGLILIGVLAATASVVVVAIVATVLVLALVAWAVREARQHPAGAEPRDALTIELEGSPISGGAKVANRVTGASGDLGAGSARVSIKNSPIDGSTVENVRTGPDRDRE